MSLLSIFFISGISIVIYQLIVFHVFNFRLISRKTIRIVYNFTFLQGKARIKQTENQLTNTKYWNESAKYFENRLKKELNL